MNIAMIRTPFKKFDKIDSSVQRTDYSEGSGSRIDSWAASTEKKNLDGGDNAPDFATPGAYGKVLINFGLSEKKVELNSKIDLIFSYDYFDPEGEFGKISVKLKNSDTVVDEKTGDFGQKEFSFPPAKICPNITIDFYDKNGKIESWLEKTFDLTCYQTSDQVKLYEIMPTNDEWIELVNFGEKEINLDGWQLEDALIKNPSKNTSKKVPFEIGDIKIKPGDFVVIYMSKTGIVLNDDSETVYLISPDGSIADQTNYKSAAKGNSWAKWGNDWYWTTKPTPGKVNTIFQPKADKSPEFNELQEAEGKKVSLVGTISEVEKSGYVVTFGGGSVEVILNQGIPEGTSGDKITVSGLNHSGSVPMIVADSTVLKRVANIVGTTNLFADENNLLLPEEQLIEIKRKIKITKRRKFEFPPSSTKSLVLGASANRGLFSSNHRQSVLYLLGVFGFMITVLIYDICCRE